MDNLETLVAIGTQDKKDKQANNDLQNYKGN